MARITFASGFGQYHSDLDTAKRPKPLCGISLEGIRHLVDHPPRGLKKNAQWILASCVKTRSKVSQIAVGYFYLLWADLDKDVDIRDVNEIMRALGYDYELFTTSNATQDNQKCRIIIPMAKHVQFKEWFMLQNILNALFVHHGIIPDESNISPNQLCFLPNKGPIYRSFRQRRGRFFEPQIHWERQIVFYEEREKLREEEKRAKVLVSEAKAKDYTTGKGLIWEFNRAYKICELLVRNHYLQSTKKPTHFRHPGSQSKSFSLSVMNGRCFALSPEDPLFSHDGYARDAFDVFAILECGGNYKSAAWLAGDEMWVDGMSWNQKQKMVWKEEQIRRSKQDE